LLDKKVVLCQNDGMIFVMTILAILLSAVNGDAGKALPFHRQLHFSLNQVGSFSDGGKKWMAGSKIFADLKGAIPKAEDIVRIVADRAIGHESDPIKFIRENFSSLVERLQRDAYDFYLSLERDGGGKALRHAFTSKLKPDASVADLLKEIELSFFELDKFFLSFSQSRKSRAGTAFQAVIGELLSRLNYPYEAQPKLRDSKPDFVLPNKGWYDFHSSDCIILTLKRTLRERWRQVPTEGNTGSTFFLATIDENAPAKELDKMQELNVRLVVPRRLKRDFYKLHPAVISFEDFLEDYLDPAVKRWTKNGLVY
jgi:EcoRII C terminal